MNRPVLGGLAALALATLAACTPNNNGPAASGTDGGGTAAAVAVTSSDAACDLSTATAPSGTITFAVENTGSKVTEFYLLASDGLRIISEVENIGPGLRRDLVVQAKPGSYIAACKPGMVGEGLRSDFTVTDSGVPLVAEGARGDQIAAATTAYVAYVRDQSEQLLTGTRAFVAAYQAGDDAKARETYAATRMNWERIEPVAESFGDLDPLMDLRQADLEEGETWSGWHLIEKDLWAPTPEANGGEAYVPLTPEQRTQFGDQLNENTQELYDRVHGQEWAGEVTATSIANGAKELLDEVATGKVTGEEEIWSHTDLWDFQANVDGARVGYEGLRDIVVEEQPDLAKDLDARFEAVQQALDAHKAGDGWVLYTELSPDQVKRLANAVDALSEPLSHLAAAVA